MALTEADADRDPLRQFETWYAAALSDAGDSPVASAVVLSTASAQGAPSARMVLLKSFGPDGFVFFTNYTSSKGDDLETNPRAAMLFYWPPDRQVRVSGAVDRVSRAESEEYWRSRPRGSQLSARASRQSRPVASREVLEARVAELGAEYPGEVPWPEFWGGYRLSPQEIEFWCHRDDRLHDRLRYRRVNSGWLLERLSP
jgi:pyridoxamine 5'-phosphate oxidase